VTKKTLLGNGTPGMIGETERASDILLDRERRVAWFPFVSVRQFRAAERESERNSARDPKQTDAR
jgi:hypothetical protein